MSLPSRECGLKFLFWLCYFQSQVSLPSRECGLKFSSCPKEWWWPVSLPSRECGLKLNQINAVYQRAMMSLPSRECGLKYMNESTVAMALSHSLRGSVDWNAGERPYIYTFIVTPFAGVWIEIISFDYFYRFFNVTPFAGVWIEINIEDPHAFTKSSLPSRECGLKSRQKTSGKDT